MKLKLFLASCVLAVAGCANVQNNGPLATEANIIQGLQTAATLGQSLYDAGKLTDAQAAQAITAFRAAYAALQAADAAQAAGDADKTAMYLRAAADALDALVAQLTAIQKKG